MCLDSVKLWPSGLPVETHPLPDSGPSGPPTAVSVHGAEVTLQHLSQADVDHHGLLQMLL